MKEQPITPAVGTTPNIARGEVLLTINGEKYPVRFGLNVLRDWSKLADKGPSDFGPMLDENYIEALAGLLTCAVRRYVPGAVFPAGFGLDDAADLIETMEPAEADNVAEAILEAITADPLVAALRTQVAAKAAAKKAGEKSGPDTSASPSAS